MGDVIEKEIDIKSLIYEIRGAKVIIDSDIARLHQVDTKRINEAVKNNPNKFPIRFSRNLTNEEKMICGRNFRLQILVVNQEAIQEFLLNNNLIM